MRTLSVPCINQQAMSDNQPRPLTIGKLAAASEVSIDTVRYYERAGLLPPPQRSASGYRLYQADTLRRLRFIRRSKALGFSLDEISRLLSLTDQDGPSSSVKQLTLDKLKLVDQKLADLQSMRDALQGLAQSCDGQGCIHHCPIVDALNREDDIPL
ncbi:MAG: MerR family transcriptional regulator [Oceanococcus sp.]